MFREVRDQETAWPDKGKQCRPFLWMDQQGMSQEGKNPTKLTADTEAKARNSIGCIEAQYKICRTYKNDTDTPICRAGIVMQM